MRRIYGILAILGSCSWSALAQPDPIKGPVPFEEMKTQIEKLLANPKILGIEGAVMGAAVKGAPYAADEVRQATQVLGDGTRIHSESKVAVYRDSEGRIRRETPNEINIWDPISGITYILNPKSMTYRRMEVHIALRRGGDTTGVSTYMFSTDPKSDPLHGLPGVFEQRAEKTIVVGPNGPLGLGGQMNVIYGGMVTKPQTKELLGTRLIEGLNCEGERSTTTIEAGAIGNDRPISSVSERWYSSELKLTTLTTKSDPRTGEETFKLSNIRRGEPDSSLFQVPAGYQPDGPTKL